MLKDDGRSEPKIKHAVDLAKSCPVCGSQNILEPDNGFPQTCECISCKATFVQPVWCEAKPNVEKPDRTKLPRTTKAIKEQKPKVSKSETKQYRRKYCQRRSSRTSQRIRLCPVCGSGWIRAPSIIKPYYRCHHCTSKFEQPVAMWVGEQ